jgi:hypothetical protein
MKALGFEFDLPVVLFVLAPLLAVSLSVYLYRWRRRWSVASRAQNWPRADGIVNSSYDLDENATALSPQNWRSEEDDDRDYEPRWSTAIQYTYHVSGEIYSGTYFLPATSSDGHIAAESGRAWLGKKIVVRYNPAKPDESVFLEQDGAPGKPHIPRLVSDRPQFTTLSLK